MKKIVFLAILMCLRALVFAQYSWNSVGSGTNLTVQSLVPDTNNKILYVGGLFTVAGGGSALNIAKWNGSTYSPLGAGILSGTGIYSLLVMPNGDLIAGGSFTDIGGILVKNIARWDGTNWSALGLGLDSINSVVVRTLAIYNNELYAGGIFNNSGGSPVNFIAKWSGSNWLPLGTGTNGVVLSLCVYNNELYAGGTFTNAGGVPVNNIAKWNGTNWSDVGGGVNYTGAISVSALQVYSGGLYAGGTFTTAGTTPVKNLAKWDGLNWFDVGGGASNYTGAISVSALQVYHGELVTGGTFDTLGTTRANYIGKWNGVSWSTLGTGMNNSVYTLAVMKDTLFAGGLFTTAGGLNTNFIAKWQPSMMTTSIYENQLNTINNFSLFPNPAVNTIHIRNKNSGGQSVTFNFVLVDALGREMSKTENIKDEINFERKNISAGLYFYKIRNHDNVILQEGKILFAD